MQCCGEPFSVGDWVEWTATSADDSRDWPSDILGEAMASRVAYLESHHGPEPPESVVLIVGRVVAVQAVFVEHEADAPGSRSLRPVRGTRLLRAVTRADGCEPDLPSRWFRGYLVQLRLSAGPAA